MATVDSPLTGSALGELEAGLRGDVVRPGEPPYDTVRAVHNGMIDRRPGAIVRCADVADVIAVVNLARRESRLLAVRGGGHNAAGLGSCDGGIVADLSAMRGVRVDVDRRTARVEGGACCATSTMRRMRSGSPRRRASSRPPGSPGSRSAAASDT